jgi:hypothetical protein
MNKKYFFILIIVLCVFVSFISLGKIRGNKAKTGSVSAVNGNSGKSDGNRFGEDASSALGENETVSHDGGRETTATASDGSKITTVFDRYGNKSETRYFNSNPRLHFIILRTTGEGYREVFVYGQDGTVRQLPENMLDKVTTASADEIANSAGVPVTIEQRSAPPPDFVLNNSQSSSIPPIQMRLLDQVSPQTIEPVAAAENTEEAKMAADGAEKKIAAAEENTRPKESKETITLNRQPEKE